MPDRLRVLWYLYTRNFVEKGGNYSSFSSKDKINFMRLVKGHLIHVGSLILENMLRTAKAQNKATALPFPSLMSHILDIHQVWYLEPNEAP